MTRRQLLESWGSVKITNFDDIEDVLEFYHNFYTFDKVENLRVSIKTRDTPDYDISERQDNALKDFWLNTKEYFDKAKTAIFEFIKLDKENGNPCIPETVPSDITEIVKPQDIVLLPDSDESPTELCLCFEYTYDDEGICVAFKNGKIVATENQDYLVR